MIRYFKVDVIFSESLNYVGSIFVFGERKVAKVVCNLETNITEIVLVLTPMVFLHHPPLLVPEVYYILENFKIVFKMNKWNCDMHAMKRKIKNTTVKSQLVL